MNLKTNVGRRSLQAIAVTLGMVACLGLGVGSASAQTGAVEGVVTDAATTAPIQGAIVMLRANIDSGGHPGHPGQMAITDENGAYVIDELEAGDYTLKCGALGYFLTTVTVEVVEGQTTVQDIALDPLAFGSVDGAVTDATTGLAIAGALVTLRPIYDTATGGGHHWLSAVTGADGMYAIENVLAGDYEVQARAYGYQPNEPVVVSVVDGQTATVDLALDPIAFGGIEGTVTDAVTGLPVADAFVSISRVWVGESGDHNGWNNHWTQTDENGFYSFDDVEVATYRVRVAAPDYVGAELEVEVLEGQVSVADFALQPLVYGSIEGTVTDLATGDPIEGALVVVLPSWMQGTDGHGAWWMARTDAAGVYRFEEVAAGEYLLKAFAYGYVPGEAVVEVFEDQTTTADFALEPREHGIARSN